jgi:deoxycytidylate deaminase
VKLAGGDCHSELEKRKLRSDIYNIVRTGTKKDKISDKEVAAVIDAVYEDTRIKDLIEFSRAIHAEMDAIVSLARSSTASALGATLFVTTFPCHSCARHIVAAGIEKVYYIEPYEKSLASELHGDSISTDPDSVDPKGDNKRLVFLHFEGVAPRQYLNLFKQHSDRKKQGVAIERTAKDFEKVVPEYLDDYQVFELKVVTHLSGLINPPPPITKDAA